MKRSAITLVIGIQLCLAMPFAVHAEEPPSGDVDRSIDPAILTQQFMSAHPDLKYRQIGMHAFDGKRFSDAFKYFQRAAYYGDNPSQGMPCGDAVERQRHGTGSRQRIHLDEPGRGAWIRAVRAGSGALLVVAE
jgi:hypothetical protein